MNLNQQFQYIRQSPTVAMNDRIVAARAAGQPVIPLQVGDPDFATPPAIIQAAAQALHSGQTHYAPSQGLPGLRQAAALKLRRDNGLEYDPESEILITHGGIHAYYLALQSILNPGDEVLLPNPSWATHANMVTLLRGVPVPVPARPEDGFFPSLEAWQAALSARTRAIVINYPSNPTGAYPSPRYLQDLQAFACAHDLWLVSDEVYENLYYEEKPLSAALGAHQRTLLIHSLSKTYAMTGWRVGYLAAPPPVLQNALKAGQASITCVAPFVQQAAAFALSDSEVQDQAARMRETYRRRRALVLEMASRRTDLPLRVNSPRGAFYFFLDFRALKMDSLELCERLLVEAGVGLVPGSAFGSQGQGFVRMTIAASEQQVQAGVQAIFDWLEKKAK